MTSIPQPTLLIIEDEPALRRGLSDYFSDSGYRTLTAENGKKGIETFLQNTVDLVFTDLRMPVMDGLELLAELGRISPETPAIVISGAGGIKDAVEAVRLGAWDYVVKPVHDLAALELLINLAADKNAIAIVNSVLALAQSLILTAVAEKMVKQHLHSCQHCHQLQGN